MFRVNLLVAVAAAGAAFGLWAFTNQPVDGPDWNGPIRGLSYSPYGINQSPVDRDIPSIELIERDIKLMATRTNRVRTYSTLDTQAEIPAIAKRHGMKVTAGAWIGDDPKRNEEELLKLYEIAKDLGTVERAIVGNEAILRKEVTAEQMIGYLRRARQELDVPVSTSEPWHIWVEHPELANEVDYLAVHILPYWEGIAHEDSLTFILSQYRRLSEMFPDKPIVLTEVGWPSKGRRLVNAVPSIVNQSRFLRQYLPVASRLNLEYFVIEAFDQPWKGTNEGRVGAYWGLWDAERQPKAVLVGPIQEVTSWVVLASLSVALAFPLVLLVLARMPDLAFSGRAFFAASINAGSMAAIWAGYTVASHYMKPMEAAVTTALMGGFLLMLAVLLTEGIELVECLWRRCIVQRPARPTGDAIEAASAPKVSVHVPCYNEPPAMVIDTIKALVDLDYPNYEVLVIDNNTKDPEVWKPVEAFCQGLAPRIRFFHVDHMPGFKAGALNFTLRHTSPDAEIVAIIDSDYMVTRDWLKKLVPLMESPDVAVVQAPQDYRDGEDGLFKTFCYWEYAGFFHLGMVQRNQRNAIIQHGTMSLIRKSALEKVGGWAEWCITEDAELGLRLLEEGYREIYVPQSFGRGLMPDTFSAYQRQRFRWAYGAIQILKKHASQVFGFGKDHLDAGQRYHFVAGWLPWFADALHLMFSVLAAGWTLAVLTGLAPREYPLTIFVLAVGCFFAFKFGKSLWLYMARVRSGFGRALGASLAGMALSLTVAKAVWTGLFTADKPFMRTPKCETRAPLIAALLASWQEILLAVAVIAPAVTLAAIFGRREPDAMLWAIIMTLHASPYIASLVMSLMSALPARKPAPAGQAALRTVAQTAGD